MATSTLEHGDSECIIASVQHGEHDLQRLCLDDMGNLKEAQLATVQEAELPPEYRKAEKAKSWWGRLYDVWDIQDKEERRLMYKLDAVLVTFMSLGYFLKYLDQANINSAFTAGMKEDLGGNELTTAITMWTIGYCLGQIPSNLLLTRISPRYWIPFLEIVWGVCTLFTYKVTTVNGLYAVRFFVGLAEAGFYPGAQFILGAFYKPSELGKRAVFFHTFGSIGTLISSVLQAAAYTNLDGVHGHAGWQWLFIVDAIITIPIAVMGLVFLPALPGQRDANKATFWMSTREWGIVDRRIKEMNRAPSRKITFARVKGYAKSWHIYVLTILYVSWNNSLNASSIMNLWLKSFSTVDTGTGIRYTVPQIQHYVMPIYGVQVLTAWFFAWTSDSWMRGRRYPWVLVTTLFNAAICIALLKLPLYKHIAAHFFLYYMTNVGGGMSGLLFSWASEICSTDNEERSLVIAFMNNFAYVVQAIVPNFTWKTLDYPKSTIGLSYSTGLSIFLFFWTLLTLHLHNRDKRRATAAYVPSQEDLAGSPDSGSIDKGDEAASVEGAEAEERRAR
ncbi:hypothetical protein JCM10207_001517 [Rhodosporidiobolus poonsookiae]